MTSSTRPIAAKVPCRARPAKPESPREMFSTAVEDSTITRPTLISRAPMTISP